MELLDNLESMAAGSMTASGNSTTQVASGLLQALEQHPGGLGAVMDNFRNNGWAATSMPYRTVPPSMTPGQAQAGLQGTDLLERAAQRAGVSPEVARWHWPQCCRW